MKMLKQIVRLITGLSILVSAVSANTTMYYPPTNSLLFYVPWPLDLAIYIAAILGVILGVMRILEWIDKREKTG